MEKYIAYDIGAISVNRAIADKDGRLLNVMPYTRHYGDPVKAILRDIESLLNKKVLKRVSGIAFTGAGGKNLSNLLDAQFINEIEAITTAIKSLHPEIQTVIEIGGQDSKFIDLTAGDYAMNELCAAGTGSFLDQQASRFNLTIEEFSDLALKSDSPSTIAGRCSVFAKSDMIHLQQEAASDEDIAFGLCYAMARSFKSGIVKGKKFQPPIIFCGGVSFNKAMVKAFEDILKEKVIIPEHQASIGAIGSAIASTRNKTDDFDLSDVSGKLSDYLVNFKYKKETFKPLIIEHSKLPETTDEKYAFSSGKVDAYIGIDVGSISTNVVAIDKDKKLISKVYLRTSGRPIEAVRKGIETIGREVGRNIDVKAVGTTGSGRYLIGDLVGADTIINEITAQATAAADIDPSVDTIFEIGGQDSKYISLQDGVIVDFEMNKICAAGTGSFLEEQAERFDIRIEDFGDRAMTAAAPLDLGERCTVFMETNVYSHYQKGARIENILAGLAYSIAINYINKVVARKKIGNRIFFQGAVAFNRSVVAAFENYLGKPIIVPQDHEVTGAIGAAIRALEGTPVSTGFRGFENISNIEYTQDSFECSGCPNMCEIKKVTIGNSKPLFYGGRCEKYEKKKSKKTRVKDLFKERDGILLNSYRLSTIDDKAKADKALEDVLSGLNTEKPGATMEQNSDRIPDKDRVRIGLPFTMLTYEFYPFWDAFFKELGIELVLSDKTNRKIINDGLGLVIAETCFPMKVVLGHIQNLIDKGVDYIFIPSIRDMPCTDNRIQGDRTGSYPCPFVQGLSSFVKAAAIDFDHEKLIYPLVNFSFREFLKNDQLQKLGKRFGKRRNQINRAIKQAYKAQEYFYSTVKNKGKELFDGLGKDEIAAVIISRPYNSCDANISMNIPGKLRDIGIQAIPVDYLPINEVDLFHEWPNMYWEFGDRILSAVDIIKKDSRLYPVYITNFGCGPDSFIMQYFEREIDRPFLKIEIDEHTAGAGVITRCEAFYDSLMNLRKIEREHGIQKVKKEKKKEPLFSRKENRVVYIPYMGDGAMAIQSTFKSAGIPAEVMYSDDETLEIGRKHTLGKECYPYIITTGDILRTLKYNDPAKCAFLMPLTHGPCRFGQYNKMQKILLKELGYDDVPIVAPGAPESSQFYKEYDMQGAKGARLLLRALVGTFAVDYLNKFLRHIRPYEINHGDTEKIYDGLVKQVCSALENPADDRIIDTLTLIMKLAQHEFEKIPVDRVPKPVIGVVGEIYVRNHPFSNNEIVRKIEALGGEVEIPDFGEWPYHTNATSKLDITVKQKDLYYKILSSFRFNNNFNGNHRNNGFEREANIKDLGYLVPNFLNGIKVFVKNRFFRMTLDRQHRLLERPIKDSDLIDLEEADIYEIWDNAEPYIIKWFGEAALSVGKSLAWIKKGADGIVNVLPFTCMPGTMVTAISKRIREEYKTPWLNLAFDGLEQGTTETRLEAFMYQANQHKKAKLEAKIPDGMKE